MQRRASARASPTSISRTARAASHRRSARRPTPPAGAAIRTLASRELTLRNNESAFLQLHRSAVALAAGFALHHRRRRTAAGFCSVTGWASETAITVPGHARPALRIHQPEPSKEPAHVTIVVARFRTNHASEHATELAAVYSLGAALTCRSRASQRANANRRTRRALLQQSRCALRDLSRTHLCIRQ